MSYYKFKSVHLGNTEISQAFIPIAFPGDQILTIMKGDQLYPALKLLTGVPVAQSRILVSLWFFNSSSSLFLKFVTTEEQTD